MRRLPFLALLLLATSLFAQDKIVRHHKIGGEGGWDYVTVDSGGRRLYQSHGDRVGVLDLDKQTVVGEIANTPGVHGVALSPDRGFVSAGRANSVVVFDRDSLKRLGDWKTTGENPDAILYDPHSRHLFTFNGRGKNITVFDAGNGNVVATIDAGGKPEFAVTDQRGRVFVNIEDTNELAAIDVKRNVIEKRWKLTGCDGPSGLAIDRLRRHLFSVCGNETMVISDADSGKVIGSAPIGKGVDGVAFDPGKNLAYSSNGRDGTITVVRATDFKVAETIPTARGARTIAVDEKTHHLFLPTAKLEPAEPRWKIVPDTFEVIEVAP
ncbi:MAG TPA: YncE family protein [Thermoanaerobaculia bacterium]|nr:YncE family protein [Thermoanaerobaculia bacterium]